MTATNEQSNVTNLDDKKKLNEIKNELITKLLDIHEPDEILIDVLGVDLYGLAEQQLEQLDVMTLLEHVTETD